jgi:hypothetical protein
MTTKTKLPESVFVEVREWFDKVNGNSYFSAKVHVNGEVAFTMPMEYGYGSHSEYRAFEELTKRGYLPENTEHKAWTWFIRDLGVTYYYTKCDSHKRDMFKVSA